MGMTTESMVETWNNHWKKIPDVGITATRQNLFKLFRLIKLPDRAKIIDVGCGAGTLARFWKDSGHDVIGVDMSDEAIALSSKKGIRCIQADISQRLPFDDNTFDLAYSDGLLEHFIEPEPVLREIWRVSRRYVLTMVPRCTLYNWAHNILFKPPREYKRSDTEWVELHKALNPATIKVRRVMFGILLIFCEKG